MENSCFQQKSSKLFMHNYNLRMQKRSYLQIIYIQNAQQSESSETIVYHLKST